MDTPVPLSSEPKSHLEEISTRWALVGDPLQFVLRYAPAVQKYLAAIVRNPQDAEEIAQDFLLRMLNRRFERVRPDRGRFRLYLKQAVRNAVREHFRRRRPESLSDEMLAALATEETAESSAERQWADQWRRCVLERAWSALEAQQRRQPGNWCYLVLRLTAEHADLDSTTLADRAARQIGRTLSAAAFRQQLSRGRRLLAKYVWNEVAATLEHPHADEVREELSQLGLLDYVRDYLRPAADE